MWSNLINSKLKFYLLILKNSLFNYRGEHIIMMSINGKQYNKKTAKFAADISYMFLSSFVHFSLFAVQFLN
ncbi:hypothetical protein PAENIP36_55310 [Paenibacillus sp. P36]